MRGLVFTEFLEMVEDTFDYDMVDTLIDNTQPKSGGAYTAVGSYDYQELENMVVELSAQSGMAVGDLLQAFGKHLAGVFTQNFAQFFVEAGSALALFREIDRHIHVEVKKLYPDAELPDFKYEDATADTPFKLHYRSERNLYLLAYGLITACFEYYSEPHKVDVKHWQEGSVHCATFEIRPEVSSQVRH
ncbi:heme NO-binding domain-containing protein [Glaciecola siphonariae]|uniref:Heme NO-binding domain-containing protein n=1 Tax=Glaciecola siphonariae TaxID=521012 RepID=A0ABV9M1H8_9ALTE